jgi:hypothetical protein
MHADECGFISRRGDGLAVGETCLGRFVAAPVPVFGRQLPREAVGQAAGQAEQAVLYGIVFYTRS